MGIQSSMSSRRSQTRANLPRPSSTARPISTSNAQASSYAERHPSKMMFRGKCSSPAACTRTSISVSASRSLETFSISFPLKRRVPPAREHAGEILLPRQERGKSAACTHEGHCVPRGFLAYVKAGFSRPQRCLALPQSVSFNLLSQGVSRDFVGDRVIAKHAVIVSTLAAIGSPVVAR